MEMDEYRVWQRVLEEPRQEMPGEALYRLAALSVQALRDYGALGQNRAAIGKLEGWERENLACIRGLFRLTAGKPLPEERMLPRGRRGADGGVLYRRALEQLQEYTALSAQPRHGVVFGEMARRQSRICAEIARMLGEISRK